MPEYPPWWFAKDNELSKSLEYRLQSNTRSGSYEPSHVYSLYQRFATCYYPILSNVFYTQFYLLGSSIAVQQCEFVT